MQNVFSSIKKKKKNTLLNGEKKNKPMGRNDGSTKQKEKRNLSRRPGDRGRNPGVGVESTDFLAFRFKGWGQVCMKGQWAEWFGERSTRPKDPCSKPRWPPGVTVHVRKTPRAGECSGAAV